MLIVFVFFKQKTAYEMRISDWSSDVCSSDLDCGRNLVGESVPVLRHSARCDPAYPRQEPADCRSGRGQLPQGGHLAATTSHARLCHEGFAAGGGGGDRKSVV